MTTEEEKLLGNDPTMLQAKDLPPAPAADNMDELDRYLSGYTKKMEVPVIPLMPGQSPPPQQGAAPFISHDPTQNPQQEYYKRGAKKGQPKPPKKGLAPPLNNTGQMAIQATSLISGALFITMMDILLPLLIATVNNWRKNSVKIDSADMKLTPSQKAELAPIGDGVVREYKINANPGALLLIAGVGMYSMAFLTAKNKAKERAEKERKEKEKQKTNEKNTINPFAHNNGQNVTPNSY